MPIYTTTSSITMEGTKELNRRMGSGKLFQEARLSTRATCPVLARINKETTEGCRPVIE